MTNEAKDINEVEVEDALVEEATKVVMGLIDDKYKNSIKVGRYLIEKFYDNDFERARKGKKVKGESLNKMLNDLQKLQNTPSKSWFYNTINLAVDDKAYKDDPDYGKLNLTHKICLTYLSKNEEWQDPKLELIREISKKRMSIRKLRERIAEIKARPGQEWPSLEEIQRMADEDKKKCTQDALQRQKKLEKAIENLKAKLEKREIDLKRCIEIIDVTRMTADSRSEQPAKLPDEQPVNHPEEKYVEDNTSEAA